MTLTYRGGLVARCEQCGNPVMVFRYEDDAEAWAQLFTYDCGACGHHERFEDPCGDDITYLTPFYSSEPKGTADCRCPRCHGTYTAELRDTVEWERNSVAVRRFETLSGTCPGCGLRYEARRDGMDLCHEGPDDERNVSELEGVR